MNEVTTTPDTGSLLIVAAPSGAGKSSLVNALLERDPNIVLSISHTTRPPRPAEREGEHYHFIDVAEFEREVAAGVFLEHALVHGNHYGTSRKLVEGAIGQGRDVLLEIDWQGARQIRKSMPEAVGTFILPPSHAELERRLRKRGSDSDEVIARRLAAARQEIAHAEEFDYLLVNDDFELAVEQLHAIVRAQRLRAPRARQRHAALLTELLGD